MSDICDLCGLTLRYGHHTLISAGRPYSFCCIGCKQVFSMLITAGGIDDPAHFRDTDLFKRCRDLGIIPASESDLQLRVQSPKVPIAAAAGGGEAHDSEAFSPSDPSNHLALLLRIDGMWCPACAWLIDASLKKLPGVLGSGCNFSTDRLRCAYDPVLTSPDRIIAFIERLGYHPALPGEGGRAQA